MADVEPIRRAKRGSATLLSLLSKDKDEKEEGRRVRTLRLGRGGTCLLFPFLIVG